MLRRKCPGQKSTIQKSIFRFSRRTPRLGGATILREDFRVGFGEEGVVQAADYFGGVVFFDHESQVNFRRALRDHANLHVFQQAENLGGDAGRVAQVLAHQADDGLASLILHVGQLGKIGGQRREWTRWSRR